jgi:hypothetical protein
MKSDHLFRKAEFRAFRSSMARTVAGVYFGISVCISMYVIWGHNDGGVWFYMLALYFPFSMIDVLIQTLAQLFFQEFIMKWLWIVDLLMFVVGGTFWYYILVKTLAFRLANHSSGSKERGDLK